jgi:hypothetical protein
MDLAERLLAQLSRAHYRTPRSVYAVVALAGVVALLVAFLAGAPLGTAAPVGIVGVAMLWGGVRGLRRWRRERKALTGFVVPLFAGPEAEAREVQRLILTRLRDELSPEEAAMVFAIDAVVGPEDRDFAEKLWERLDALFVVHGEVRPRADVGRYSVDARVLQPAFEVLHLDPHTKDVIPHKVRWRFGVSRLTPQQRAVHAGAFPPDFARELEAIVQGFGGMLASVVRDDERAVKLLREAIARAPRSRSHLIDMMRVFLARSRARLGEPDAALNELRARAQEGDASPELLRTIHHIIFVRAKEAQRPQIHAERAEGIQCLREAAGHRSDPAREQTVYNLSNILAFGSEAEDAEAGELLLELTQSPSYRRAWYVHRDLGGRAWYDHVTKCAAGDHVGCQVAAREAARRYSLAVRFRPRVAFLRADGTGRRRLVRRFPPGTVIFANARDAYRNSGQRLRQAWYSIRFRELRRRCRRRGRRAIRRGDYQRAYEWFDWGVVTDDSGYLDPFDEEMKAGRDLALRQASGPPPKEPQQEAA